MLFGTIALYDIDVFTDLRNDALNGIFLEDARFIDANAKIGYDATALKLMELAILNLRQQQSARYCADVESCNTF